MGANRRFEVHNPNRRWRHAEQLVPRSDNPNEGECTHTLAPIDEEDHSQWKE